jgi:hypothetical protein
VGVYRTIAYRDKKVVGVFVRFRYFIPQFDTIIKNYDLEYCQGRSLELVKDFCEKIKTITQRFPKE